MQESQKKKFQYISIAFLFLAGSALIAFFRGMDGNADLKLLDSLHYANGTKFDPATIQNKKKVIYFWATWCSTCNTNLPFLKTNFKSLSRFSDTVFISVEEGDSKAELDKYIQEKNIEFPVLFGNEEILKTWHIAYYPTMLFINEKNQIRFSDTGILNPISFWIRIFLL